MSWKEFIISLHEHAGKISNSDALIESIPDELLCTHKFDTYLSTALIRKRVAVEWVDLAGVKVLIEKLNQAV